MSAPGHGEAVPSEMSTLVGSGHREPADLNIARFAHAGADLDAARSHHMHGSEQQGPYRPLQADEIRILRLEPGQFSDPLRGSLEHLHVSDLRKPLDAFRDKKGNVLRNVEIGKYEALSYVWGDPAPVNSLSLIDSTDLPLGKSLYEALRYMRLANEVRSLWVDAICIEQANEDEKSAQVTVMAMIYFRAKATLVWLGAPDSSTALAFAMIRHFADNKYKQGQFYDVASSLLPSPRCSCCGTDFVVHPGSVAAEGLSAVLDIVSRPWFTRLWVVQEVYAGYQRGLLRCGYHWSTIEAFMDTHRFILWFVHRYGTSVRSSDAPLRAVLQEKIVRFVDATETFTEAVWSYGYENRVRDILRISHRHCKDSRDRLFAMRSVLRIEKVEALRPDYSLSVEEVFRRLTVHCIQSQDNGTFGPYAVLGIIGTESERTTPSERIAVDKISPATDGQTSLVTKPTWVPNFHGFTEHTRIKVQLSQLRYDQNQAKQFHSKPAEIRSRISENGRCLAMPGRIFANVGRLLYDAESDATQSQILSECERNAAAVGWARHLLTHMQSTLLISCHELCEMSLSIILTDCLIFDDFEASRVRSVSLTATQAELKAILISMYRNEFAVRRFYGLGRRLDLACQLLAGKESRWIVGNPVSNCDRVLRFIHSVRGVELGWVPQYTQPGDELCYFRYAPNPFIVRSAGNHNHKLVGEARTFGTTLEEAVGGTCGSRAGSRTDHHHFSCLSWNRKLPAGSVTPEPPDRGTCARIDELEWMTLV